MQQEGGKTGRTRGWLEANPQVLRALKITGFAIVGAAILALVAVAIVVDRYSEDLPSVEQLKSGYNPPQLTRVLARDGAVLADLFTERRTVVTFSEVPDNAKLTFLAAKDATFYEHK